MADSDNGTVTVEIESPTEETDANNNGVSDGIEIGQATANAEHAAETAENAATSAESAENTAQIALEETARNTSDLNTIGQATAANTVALNQLIDHVRALTDVVKAQAEMQLDSAAPAPEPRPEDTAPRNTHWLNKRWFGKDSE